jgi:D-alanyl-D-alanine carboxypeptidase
MTAHTSPSFRTTRRNRFALASTGVLIVAALLAILIYAASSVSSSHAAIGSGIRDDLAIGEAGGDVPDGTSVFDDTPGVAALNPELLTVLRAAAADAALDDVHFIVNSGWRSAAYQQQLLHDAIAQYGSEEEAARWVATPATSAHVKGDAVDIGSFDATAWLSENGAAYGLCQIYVNEPWHYELRPNTLEEGCPSMFIDPTHDPRTQR